MYSPPLSGQCKHVIMIPLQRQRVPQVHSWRPEPLGEGKVLLFCARVSAPSRKNQKNGIRSKWFVCLSFHYPMLLLVTNSKFMDRGAGLTVEQRSTQALEETPTCIISFNLHTCCVRKTVFVSIVELREENAETQNCQ